MLTFMPSKLPSEPSRSRRQSGRCFPTIRLYFFFFFMRSKVTMLKLHVEETKMSISDTPVAFSRQTHLVDVHLVARLTTICFRVATPSRQTQLTDVCSELKPCILNTLPVDVSEA